MRLIVGRLSERPEGVSAFNGGMPLVIAATPIGTAGDASLRLRDALGTADVIAAEDTRRVRRLARELGVEPTGRIVAVYDAVERDRAAGLLDEIAGGGSVLLVSDAGMPLVSDPGHLLVTGAIERGLPITVLPGPSAVTAAIAVCGLPVARWCFEGFLPRRGGERRTRIGQLAGDPRATVIFESPRRLAATLSDLVGGLGADRPAAVCRELTKTYQEIRRGTLGELAEWAAGGEVRGEITIVVGGASRPDPEPDAATLRDEVEQLVAGGMSRRDAVEDISQRRGLSRRTVYNATL
jgi:16S rRNA (cytidine1402-2'-O)-methyltransferase